MRLCDPGAPPAAFLTWKTRRGIRQPVENFPTGYYVPFLKNLDVNQFVHYHIIWVIK